MNDVEETLIVASLSLLPGTDVEQLAQRLADALVLLRPPAAALIAPVDVPPDIADQVRGFAATQQLAEAAADYLILVTRIYYRPAGRVATDPFETAVAVRELWQQEVAGAETGLVGVTMVPVIDPARWLYAVRRPPWIVETSNGPLGLLPNGSSDT